jgi:hypothetical protein
MYLFYVMDVKLIYTSTNRVGSNLVPNAIAFDLDETIGSFSDFYSIWARLEPSMKTQPIFEEILDLYPEFLRVGFFAILRYVFMKQESGNCLPIYIYTNNQCEDISWIYKLVDYLESRVFPGKTVKLFARPIFAFKIKNKVVEKNRTTHEKTYKDFVKCSMLSNSSELCFIDDLYHKKMKHPRVYYIQPPPYVHSLSHKEVVDRFIESDVYRKLYPLRITYDGKPSPVIPRTSHTKCSTFSDATAFFAVTDKLKNTNNNSMRIDELIEKEEQRITNKIMYFIREFFFVSAKKHVTKKRRPKIGNFSRKKHRYHADCS